MSLVERSRGPPRSCHDAAPLVEAVNRGIESYDNQGRTPLRWPQISQFLAAPSLLLVIDSREPLLVPSCHRSTG